MFEKVRFNCVDVCVCVFKVPLFTLNKALAFAVSYTGLTRPCFDLTGSAAETPTIGPCLRDLRLSFCSTLLTTSLAMDAHGGNLICYVF